MFVLCWSSDDPLCFCVGCVVGRPLIPAEGLLGAYLLQGWSPISHPGHVVCTYMVCSHGGNWGFEDGYGNGNPLPQWKNTLTPSRVKLFLK